MAKMLQDFGAEMNRKNRSHTQSGGNQGNQVGVGHVDQMPLNNSRQQDKLIVSLAFGRSLVDRTSGQGRLRQASHASGPCPKVFAVRIASNSLNRISKIALAEACGIEFNGPCAIKRA